MKTESINMGAPEGAQDMFKEATKGRTMTNYDTDWIKSFWLDDPNFTYYLPDLSSLESEETDKREGTSDKNPEGDDTHDTVDSNNDQTLTKDVDADEEKDEKGDDYVLKLIEEIEQWEMEHSQDKWTQIKEQTKTDTAIRDRLNQWRKKHFSPRLNIRDMVDVRHSFKSARDVRMYKFYLQDTKSSNGTFVNNQRLSKGSEESPPREICSGDIIQFGVDVMENSRRVTHGCIIASISLFYPDGREAKPSYPNSSPFLNGGPAAAVQSQEIYQLARYLEEALHREQMLENKLATLQRLLHNTQEASENGWQALIDEDRLLSRLEMLEGQLQVYQKKDEDSLREELVALQEDKSNYETTAKESLRRVLQEKLEAVRKLTELERSLSNTEEECSHMKEVCEASQQELQQLAEKHQEQMQDMAQLQEKLQEAEKNHAEEQERTEKEKAELQAKLEEMIKQENILSAKVESLQADNDFTQEQLSSTKARMEAMKEGGTSMTSVETESQSVQVESEYIIDGTETDIETELKEKLRELQSQIEQYKTQLADSETRLQESREKVDQLQNQLEEAQTEAVSHITKIASVEEKLSLCDIHMNQMVENAAADLNIQLKESNKQRDGAETLTRELQDQIRDLEEEVAAYRHQGENMVLHISEDDSTNSNDITLPNHLDDDLPSTTAAISYREEIERLKELLQEARDAQKKTEMEIERCKRELGDAKDAARKAKEEAVLYHAQLHDAKIESKDRSEHVMDLQDQLNKAEATTKEVKQQILALRDRLLEEQEQTRINHSEAERLKKQLLEAQQAAKQSHNEAEQLRAKIKVLQTELDNERGKTRQLTHVENIERQAVRNKEFAALKEECANLRKRIQAIEIEMKMSRSENSALSTDYNQLQESYLELEELKDKLENKEITWQINLTDAQKTSDQSKTEVGDTLDTKLVEANNSLASMKDKCEDHNEQISLLSDELGTLTDEFRQLSDRSKILSGCCMVPLFMLFFAIVIAFYPTLSEITATTS